MRRKRRPSNSNHGRRGEAFKPAQQNLHPRGLTVILQMNDTKHHVGHHRNPIVLGIHVVEAAATPRGRRGPRPSAFAISLPQGPSNEPTSSFLESHLLQHIVDKQLQELAAADGRPSSSSRRHRPPPGRMCAMCGQAVPLVVVKPSPGSRKPLQL